MFLDSKLIEVAFFLLMTARGGLISDVTLIIIYTMTYNIIMA